MSHAHIIVDRQPDTGLEPRPQDMGPARVVAPMPSGSRRGPRWHVFATYPQAERRATAHLVQQGYEAWLPLVTVARRDRVIRSMLHRIEVPLFPSYGFVRFDASTTEWWPIRNTPGVFHLFTIAHVPHPVPHGVVEALQATQDARRSVDASRTSWPPGTACSVSVGPFRGHDAVVIGTRDGRTLVGVMCFGAMREVSVSSDCLMARE